jgi:hypothetical protein
MEKLIAVYGGKFCYVYVDVEIPTRTIQKIIEQQDAGIRRFRPVTV